MHEHKREPDHHLWRRSGIRRTMAMAFANGAKVLITGHRREPLVAVVATHPMHPARRGMVSSQKR